MIHLFETSSDSVIKSAVMLGSTTYEFALTEIYPLINKFDEQRKIQRRKFYERLKNDIVRGCIMPPITLAFVDPDLAKVQDTNTLQDFVNRKINNGYVLDGMQRLTTLNEASHDINFDRTKPLPVNVIVAERYDLLLYRMITLNNGQKPMTARHQIEMLTKGMLDTQNLTLPIVSEKDTEQTNHPGSFKRSDIAAAYTAFLTNSVNNENSRIIESKLDEILVGKVMESNLSEEQHSFNDILKLVERFSENEIAKNWLRLGNNLIGFTIGAKSSFDKLSRLSAEDFSKIAKIFDEAFKSLASSKINVGKFRRELSAKYISQFDLYNLEDPEEVVEMFMEETMVE